MDGSLILDENHPFVQIETAINNKLGKHGEVSIFAYGAHLTDE